MLLKYFSLINYLKESILGNAFSEKGPKTVADLTTIIEFKPEKAIIYKQKVIGDWEINQAPLPYVWQVRNSLVAQYKETAA